MQEPHRQAPTGVGGTGDWDHASAESFEVGGTARLPLLNFATYLLDETYGFPESIPQASVVWHRGQQACDQGGWHRRLPHCELVAGPQRAGPVSGREVQVGGAEVPQDSSNADSATGFRQWMAPNVRILECCFPVWVEPTFVERKKTPMCITSASWTVCCKLQALVYLRGLREAWGRHDGVVDRRC